MDERVLQLKQMKKTYRRMKAGAGRGWKVLAWVFFVLCLLTTGITLFVRFNTVPFIQRIDTKLWEPFKAAAKLGIDYAGAWRLTERYGSAAALCSGGLWLIFAFLGLRAVSGVKRTEEFLNLRTLQLTLKTEKEEK